MKLSIIVPVYNESAHIQGVLRGLFAQEWDGPLDIVIVDGGSTDGTPDRIREVMPEVPQNVQIRVLQNPQRHIPISLNIGVRAAKGDIVIRLDGHTIPPRDFVSRSIKALELAGGKAVVGGRWQIQPANESACAEAIALAVSHPVGIGNALYRTYQPAQHDNANLLNVDTVPFGAYPKKLWEELGGYDEKLLTSEDYDFVLRARKKGYPVLMDPNLVLRYIARSTLLDLWKQYFRYGYWTVRLLAKHRCVPTARKLAPLLLVLTSISLLILNLVWGAVWVTLYLLSILGMVLLETTRGKCNLTQAPYLYGAFITLHWAYGIGNLAGLLSLIQFGRESE
jgi:glycosyltransferase involved in cell wall biosynthesis